MEEYLINSDAPQKHSVWDNYVPVVVSGRTTNIYLTDQIEAPSEYNQLCHILDNAWPGDKIVLHINNGGGWVDSGFMIINAINNSKAHTVAKLSGTVASVSTMITLACDTVITGDYTSFMIHNYSGGAQGKGHEMKAQVDFTDAQLNLTFAEVYKGFLTPHEMELVIAGKDIWMGKEELEARLTARGEDNAEALTKIEAKRKVK